MKKSSDDLFRSVIDLNDIIAFEYDRKKDTVKFSNNIDRYIPSPHNISDFVQKLSNRGKIHNDDVEKAISFFTLMPDDGKVKMEYVRFLDFSGEFPLGQRYGGPSGGEHE